MALISGLSLAQSDLNGTGTGNATQPALAAESSQPADLQGIWSVSLGSGDQNQQVTIVLHQSSSQVYGSAKSEESNPWNAVVSGSIDGSRLELTMTSLKGTSLAATKLMGTIVKGSISGMYLQSDDQGGYGSNLFTATLINPDTSSYSPAQIEATKSSPQAGAQPQTEAQSQSESSSHASPGITSSIAPVPVSDTSKPVQLGNTYKDVHSIASTVPESLGVGFIGDGTMGAGGASMS